MPLQKNTVIVDANVILRYLLRDSERFYEKAESLFDEVFSGKKSIRILHSVVAEVVYVLLKLYKVSRKEIVEVLIELIKAKGIKIQDKEVLFQALEIFREKNLDFVDCLLCVYSKKYQVISFDDKLNRCMKDIDK